MSYYKQSFQTVKVLDLTVCSESLSPYQHLIDTNYNVRSILEAQVDLPRALQILDTIAFELQRDASQGLELIDLLVKCAQNAVSDIYNSSTSNAPVDVQGRFGRLHRFARNKLGVEPVPSQRPVQQTTEERTRLYVSRRDTTGSYNIWSGAQCVFTGLPNAEMAHIIPQNTAGALEGHRWFWLWAAICLPKHVYDAAWLLCGGPNQHAPANVIMMAPQMHKRFDSLLICLNPIIDSLNPNSNYYALEMTVPSKIQPPVMFERLYTRDENRQIASGTTFWWQSFTQTAVEEAPSPLLFSLHGWITMQKWQLFPNSTDKPPRSLRPSAFGSKSPQFELVIDQDNKQWSLVAGQGRSGSRSRSPSVASSGRGSRLSPLLRSSTSPQPPSPLSFQTRALGHMPITETLMQEDDTDRPFTDGAYEVDNLKSNQAMVACFYCGHQVPVELLADHTTDCMNEQAQRGRKMHRD